MKLVGEGLSKRPAIEEGPAVFVDLGCGTESPIARSALRRLNADAKVVGIDSDILNIAQRNQNPV